MKRQKDISPEYTYKHMRENITTKLSWLKGERRHRAGFPNLLQKSPGMQIFHTKESRRCANSNSEKITFTRPVRVGMLVVLRVGDI